MITKCTIYGERCSGTNYLEKLIELNFNVKITWEYGWKHFFGFNNLNNSDNTLFIGITKNPYDWINSFYREQYHLPNHFKNMNSFLNNEFYSVHAHDTNEEVMTDRSMYTKERYKNIFDMRHSKLKFLIEDMPSLVKNYILIRNEDLVYDFKNTMNKIQKKGLLFKKNIHFPVNYLIDVKTNKPFIKNTKLEYISKEKIKEKINMTYENKLYYDL
jgi:hypothetical protein